MKVEIWSDVVCPFCYIGKRRFEEALKQLPGNRPIEIEWKSFLLSPGLKTDPTINIHQYLAMHKGVSVQEAERMNAYVTKMAADVGLTYRFDLAVPANTFNAHRFLHFAKNEGKQTAAKERLLNAFFTEGKNLDNYDTLLKLGEAIGLDYPRLKNTLEEGLFAEEVRADIEEGYELGLPGVPFFVFNRRLAISGAQPEEVFLQTLVKAISLQE